MKNKLLFSLFVAFFTITSYSQSTTCADADPICGNDGFDFPNTSGAGQAEPGINYGCLISQPNPAWFFLNVSVAGTLNFEISQTNASGGGLDVDFIVWGPFSTPNACGPANLNSGNQVACSFSAAPIENFTLFNALPGQFYVLLITNYSNQPGTIVLDQTDPPGVGGATNCDILCPLSISPTAGDQAVLCPGASSPITVNFENATNPTYIWYFNGVVMAGETGPTVIATAPGEYCVDVDAENCEPQSECTTILPPPVPPITQIPLTLNGSGTPAYFDLTTYDIAYLGLDPDFYEVDYYATLSDSQNGINPISATQDVTNYPGVDGQIIYIGVLDYLTNCFTTFPFELIVTQPVSPNTPPNLSECEAIYNTGIAEFFMAGQVNNTLQPSDDPLDFNITFHTSQADADADTGAITAEPYTNVTPYLQTIYVRMENAADPTNYAVTTFDLIVHLLPETPNPTDVLSCGPYSLPAPPAGTTWNSAPGGNPATALVEGDQITSDQVIYNFAQSGTSPNCTAEGSFTVTVVTVPVLPVIGDVVRCLEYELPAPPAGSNYYTGTNGGLPLIPAGTFITATQDIYVFAQTGTTPNCTDEEVFTVTIVPVPNTPTVQNVSNCGPYTLPALTSPTQSYYSDTFLSGTPIAAGTPINSTQTIWVVDQTGTTPNCYAENSFTVTIFPIPVADAPGDVVRCDEYPLPALTNGNYFAGPDGTLTAYFAGDIIYSTMTMYVYTDSGLAGCTAENSFEITINNTPTAPTVADITVCDFYELPVLTSPTQSYYDGAFPGGSPIAAGTPINTTQTIWVVDQTGTSPNCFAQSSFVVTIVPIPAVDDLADQTRCDVYTLPGLTNGNYFAGPGGALPAYFAGDDIDSTMTMYIYSESGLAGCTSETSFEITIIDSPIAPAVSDVTACGFYILPDLTSPTQSYYSDAFPSGSPIAEQTQIDATQTIWVVDQTGTSPNCFAQSSFVVTIVPIPAVDDLADQTRCDVYTLPALTNGNYFAGPGGGLPAYFEGDIIDSTMTMYIYSESGLAGCTSETSFEITIIDSPLAPTVGDITVCDFYELPVLTSPTQSYYDAAFPGGSPIAAGTSIDATQTIWVVDQTGTTPNCFAQSSFVVTIVPIPQVDNLPDAVSCDFYVLPALANGNYFGSPNGGAPAYFEGDVIQSSMTMYVYAQSGTTPNCTAQTDFEIGIFEFPIINNPSPLQICDDNFDGVACFADLSVKDAEITGADPNLVVTYHETPEDAQSGNLPVNPINYCSLSGMQMLYVRVAHTDAPQCASFTTMVLTVNPRPVVPAQVADYALCDGNDDGIENFDLEQMTPTLVGNQTGITVTYYLSDADAQSATNAIDTSVPFPNTTSPQQICARLETASGCFSVVCFNIVVNPLPQIIDPQPMNSCSDGISPEAEFVLTDNDATITQNMGGLQVSYHETLLDAQNDTAAIQNAGSYMSASTTIYVRVEDVATGCFVTTTLQLIVNQGPIALTPNPLHECDLNNDGFAVFTLEDANLDINGGSPQPGVVITYHETMFDAENGLLPFTSPYPNIDQYQQTIFVRVEYAFTGCTAFTELLLIVDPTPEANANAQPLEQCDTNADGFAIFDLTQATSDIMETIDPAVHTITFHVLESSAVAGTQPISSPAAYTNINANNQTIWVRVTHNTTACFDVVPLQLIVNPQPLVAVPIATYTLCDSDPSANQSEEFDLASQIPGILNGQLGMEVTFHLNQADADQGANDLPLNYTTGPVQTIYVRVTNVATNCYAISTIDLRVEPIPAPVVPSPTDPLLNLCDTDGDGIAVFDLTALISDMQQGTTTFDVTFYETQLNAENAADAIGTPSAYQNNNPYMETVWVRAQNSTSGCFMVFPIVLNVTASPVIGTLGDLTLCDTDSNNQDGIATFDLTDQNTVILDMQSGPAANYTISYYTSIALAQNGTQSILQPQNHRNTTSPFSQEIWVRIQDATSECVAINSFMLIVDTPLLLVAPPAFSVCDQDPDDGMTMATFDLTAMTNAITANASGPGYTIAFFTNVVDQQNNTNAIANPEAYVSSVSTTNIFVAVTSPGGCRSFTTVTIRVIPTPNPQQDLSGLELQECDINGDGQELFDLTQNQQFIANGDPNLSFSYFVSQADANVPQNAIADPTQHLSASDTIYIRVNNILATDYQGNNCYVIVEQEIIVNPLPVINTPVPLPGCDATNSGTAVFDLQGQANELVLDGTLDEADYTFTYHTSAGDADLGQNPINDMYTSGPATIYVRVQNNDTGCYIVGELNLSVSAGATATAYDPDVNPSPLIKCADLTSANNDTATFDLNTIAADIRGAQAAADFTVNFYESLANAQDDIVIADYAQYISPTGFVYATVTNNLTLCRSAIVAIEVTVEPLPVHTIESVMGGNTICVEWGTEDLLSGLELTSTLTNTDDYTYQWFLNTVAIPGATSPSYLAIEEGIYSLTITSTTAQLCPYTAEFEVIISGPAVVEAAASPGWTVTNAFADSQDLIVTVAGYGNYHYSLDYGPFVDNDGVFTNIGPGTHFVTVRDMNTNSCKDDLVIQNIRAINYPHFFTPNGDGINDTWNIFSLRGDATAKIYIFDRYGKLIKQISPEGLGWDGTYSGQMLPSDDYWFTVNYTEANVTDPTAAGQAREFKAHFSLKR